MRILMIEDDIALCEAVAYQLQQQGLTVDICHDGSDGLRWAAQEAHDLILLDRMLPGMDGVTVLRRLRAMGSQTPVLILTALGGIHDRVEGLDAGADDYLVKPFAIEELLARIRAMSRRPRQWEDGSLISCGDIRYTEREKQLHGPGGSCSLSKRESDLFSFFFKNPGQILPRPTLLAHVWGPDAEVEEGNLDNYIHFLRRRLRTVGSRITIQTVRGVGYRLQLPEG